jgi:hypothetical protein
MQYAIAPNCSSRLIVLNCAPMYRSLLTLVLVFIATACATIPPGERAAIREELDANAEEMLAQLTEKIPRFSEKLEESVGYLAGSVSGVKGPLAGGGYGRAVLVDRELETRSYLDITRLDVGAGLGTGKVRAFVLFQNRALMEGFARGVRQPMLRAASVAGESSEYAVQQGDGYLIFLAAEKGAALTATAALVKARVNNDLTNTGVADVSLPVTGPPSSGEQEEFAPRNWDRRLPFLAQKVIDTGYDLPLPLGIGLTYSDVEQEQLLRNLSVGINGSPVVPLEFVGFDNAQSNSETLSIKADAWLFPFMNVYAMIGRVEGEAPVDVLLDGNTILDGLDVDCGSFPPNPLCPLLQDEVITLPIEARFRGTTYGIGTTLAAGWNGWFVTLPFNWTYADMQSSDTDGASFTATPRVGRLINLGRRGNLALFVGGNYLDTDLTVDGLATAPGGQFTFDYIVDQENKDKWNALAGFNWDITRRLSWSAEYDGLTGSRDAFISSLVWRF